MGISRSCNLWHCERIFEEVFNSLQVCFRVCDSTSYVRAVYRRLFSKSTGLHSGISAWHRKIYKRIRNLSLVFDFVVRTSNHTGMCTFGSAFNINIQIEKSHKCRTSAQWNQNKSANQFSDHLPSHTATSCARNQLLCAYYQLEIEKVYTRSKLFVFLVYHTGYWRLGGLLYDVVYLRFQRLTTV